MSTLGNTQFNNIFNYTQKCKHKPIAFAFIHIHEVQSQWNTRILL